MTQNISGPRFNHIRMSSLGHSPQSSWQLTVQQLARAEVPEHPAGRPGLVRHTHPEEVLAVRGQATQHLAILISMVGNLPRASKWIREYLGF